MSKRLALISAAAFGALALTAAVVAPVSAQDKMMKSEMSGEKTVMVAAPRCSRRRTSSRTP
jgi:hypothetical protein